MTLFRGQSTLEPREPSCSALSASIPEHLRLDSRWATAFGWAKHESRKRSQVGLNSMAAAGSCERTNVRPVPQCNLRNTQGHKCVLFTHHLGSRQLLGIEKVPSLRRHYISDRVWKSVLPGFKLLCCEMSLLHSGQWSPGEMPDSVGSE